MTCTTCAVGAAAGAGSNGRNSIFDASRNTVITPHYSNRARKANAMYYAPIATSTRRYDAVFPDSSTQRRRTRSLLQSILNLDINLIQASVENLDSTHFFKLPKSLVPCSTAVPWLLQIEGSIQDVSSKTLAVQCRGVDEAHNLLACVTIRLGVVAEVSAGSN